MAGQGADLRGKSAGAARFVFLLTQGGFFAGFRQGA